MFAVFSAAELFKVASISSRTLPYGHRHAKLSFHLYKEGYARPAPVRIGDPREAPGLQIQMSIQKDVPEQINSAMGKGGVPCPAIAVARASRCVIALVQDFPAAMRTVERFQASFFELGELFVAGMRKSGAAKRLEALSIS